MYKTRGVSVDRDTSWVYLRTKQAYADLVFLFISSATDAPKRSDANTMETMEITQRCDTMTVMENAKIRADMMTSKMDTINPIPDFAVRFLSKKRITK